MYFYWTGMLGTSVQVFGGGQLGVWAQEVGRELGPNVGQPRKCS